MRSFTKDILRSIRKSQSRFWAIFGIVALGAGFFCGLNATGSDMRRTSDAYADRSHLMDVEILSTLGLTEEDVEEIRKVDGVQAVMPAYQKDAMVKLGESEETVARFHSLPAEGDDSINEPVLVEGRMPENEGECVVGTSSTIGGKEIAIGDKLVLAEEKAEENDLNHREYEIVGLVETSYYLSFSMGTSSIGNGRVGLYAYLLPGEFDSDCYTDLFLTVCGAEELDCFSQEYRDTVDAVQEKLEELSKTRLPLRREELVGEAQEELDKAKAEYEEKESEVNTQLEEAQQQLEDAELLLNEKEQQLQQAEESIEENERTLQEAKEQLDLGWKEYENGRDMLESQKAQAQAQLEEAKEQLKEYEDEYDSGKMQVDLATSALGLVQQQLDLTQNLLDSLSKAAEILPEDGSVRENLEALQKNVDDLQQQCAQKQAELEEANRQLEQARKELDKAQQEYDTQKQLADEQLAQAEEQMNDSYEQLREGNQEYLSGLTQLNQARKQVQDGKKQLEQGREELEEKKQQFEEESQKAQKELRSAKRKLQDAQTELDNVEQGTWYVLDRSTNVGFASMENDSSRMDSLCTVFPVIFFLVALLVVLTTMTRYVEEERILIGTYKALGYGGGTILMKYTWYAAVPTLLGCIVGPLIGFYALPEVVWNAYRLMYTVPDLIAPVRFDLMLASLAILMLTTVAATMAAVLEHLREEPAALMMPRAPKNGKHVLLEHVPFIWNRLSFTHKVTVRNLFRYKKRLVMTITGIAGCTALLVTGFGIKDSISDIVHLEYSELSLYNYSAATVENLSAEEADEILSETGAEFMRCMMKNMDCSTGRDERSVYLLVPEDTVQISSYLNFRTRNSHQEIPFGEDSVLITEKLSDKLGAGAGDTVTLSDGTHRYQVKVTGVVEHYVYDYVYMAPQVYKEVFGKEAAMNQLLIQAPEDVEKMEKALEQSELVKTYVNVAENAADFDRMLSSLDLVVMVIILCAGLLAFIVLYNLTNINVTERQREIATIKVLGFTDREVNAYVYRETFLLTLLGSLVGLVLGVILHSYVINTVEVDMVMFGHDVKALSFVISIIITMLFSAIVNLVINGKLKKIDMVESLKSVD